MAKVKVTQKQLEAWNAYFEARKKERVPRPSVVAKNMGISGAAFRQRLASLAAKGLIHIVGLRKPSRREINGRRGGRRVVVYAEGPAPARKTRRRKTPKAKPAKPAIPNPSIPKDEKINSALTLWRKYNDFRERYVCPTMTRFGLEVDENRHTVELAFLLLIQEGYIVRVDSGCKTPIYLRAPEPKQIVCQ